MSDTPRTNEKLLILCTDSWEGGSGWMGSDGASSAPENEQYVPASLARELERDLNEQVVCNGKGAEREADLLGKLDRLERENARLSKIIHEAYTPLAKCFHGEWDECNVEHAYLVLKSA